MFTFGEIGLAILGLGTYVAHAYNVSAGLGIFAVGVVLTSFAAAKFKKEILAKA